MPSPSSSELSAIIQTAVEDRNSTALDVPNGPSNVPSGYSLPQTATFRASADGWQLDSITPLVHGGGLPMSIVE